MEISKTKLIDPLTPNSVGSDLLFFPINLLRTLNFFVILSQ